MIFSISSAVYILAGTGFGGGLGVDGPSLVSSLSGVPSARAAPTRYWSCGKSVVGLGVRVVRLGSGVDFLKAPVRRLLKMSGDGGRLLIVLRVQQPKNRHNSMKTIWIAEKGWGGVDRVSAKRILIKLLLKSIEF